MSTNLEKRSFDLEVNKINERMERSLDVIDKKFNDAIQKIDNFKYKMEETISESNIDTKASEIISLISDKQSINTQLRNHFVMTSIGVDDITQLASKYTDNKFKLADMATNGAIPDNPSFVDDGALIHGSSYKTVSTITNDSFQDLTGVNALDNGDPTFAKQFTITTGHSRSLFITLFDTISNLTSADDLITQQPFTKGYDNVRGTDHKPGQSTPFIVIERINKINSFDFGIEYVTKADSMKCYIKDTNQSILLETAFHTNSSAFVKRYFGSFILEDFGDSIKSSYILKRSDKSLFENDNPEFVFRLAFDEQYIMIFLEKVRPCRLVYSEIENPSDTPDFYNADGSLSQVFVRDILEMISNEDRDMNINDSVLSIVNKFGVSKEFFGSNVGDITKDILNILTPFRDNPSSIENIYLIPNYVVNFSMKDNGFHIKDNFIVGQIYGRDDILDLPYSLMTITPKSNTMFQLEGINLTDSNNIEITSDVEKSLFNKVNTIFSTEDRLFVKGDSIIDLINQASDFVKDHYIDDQSVFYTARILITTMLNDGLKVDTNKIPDYVIDEIGKYVKTGDNDSFYCTYYITHTKTNETISITTDKELRDFITKTPIKFKYLTDIDNGNPIYSESPNQLPIRGNTFGGIPQGNILHILYNPLFGVNPGDDFNGLVRLTVKILPDMYDYEDITVNHVTMNDDQFLFGEVAEKYPNSQRLPNQAMVTSTILKYKSVTVTGYENCIIKPTDTEIKAVLGSTIVYTITPLFLYKIDRVLVNGIETALLDNKIIIRNISEDIIIEIQSSLRDLLRVITITNAENCSIINPSSGPINIDEGESITFNIIPVNGYRLTSAIANGINVDYINNNSFSLKNVMVDTDLEIICTEIPKIEYNINITPSTYGDISPAPGQYLLYEGDNYEINIIPNENFQILGYSINGAFFSITGELLEPGPTPPLTTIVINNNIVQLNGIKETLNITVNIEEIPPNIYTINTSITNGLLSPIDDTPAGVFVIENNDLVFTVTPDLGYYIEIISVNGIEITMSNEIPGVLIDGNTITFVSVQSDASLEITCSIIPPVTHLISINIPVDSLFTIHNTDGTTDDLEYNEGSRPVFTIIPNSGYYVTHVIINGVEIPVTSSIYLFDPISGPVTISAIVAVTPINVYTVSVSRLNKSEISITPNYLVNEGEDITITIVPFVGHELEIVKINGVIQNPIESIINITAVSMDYDIYISSKPIYVPIEPISGNNYRISPNIITPVQYGNGQPFEIIPDEGYIVDTVIIGTGGIDADPIESGRFYIFENVIEPHTIKATVVKRLFLVTPLGGDSYTVTPSIPEMIEFDENSSEFSFIPNTGKYITSIYEGSTEIYHNSNAMYEPQPGYDLTQLIVKHTVINVRKSTLVRAVASSFLARSYTVTTNIDSDQCTVTPGIFVTIGKGGTVSITIETKPGFRLKTVYINGIIREMFGNDYTYYESFVNISNDIIINVTSEVRPPVIYSVTHGPNTSCRTICLNPDILLNPLGTISNPVKTYEGGSLVFRAIPVNYLYRISKFVLNDVSNIPTDGGYGDKEFTIASVDDNMRISAVAVMIVHKINLVLAINCTVLGFDGNGSFIAVNHNVNFTLQFVPNADHEIDLLSINGETMSAIGNSFLISNIVEDKNVSISYIPKLFITVHTGVNCKYDVYLSGTPLSLNAVSGVWRIARKTNYFKVTVVPDEGYEIDRSWISAPTVTIPDTGNIQYQEVLTNPGEIIFNNILENKGFYAQCKKKIFNIVVIQPTPNGEITYNGDIVSNVPAEYGDSKTFTITPNVGYRIAILRINGSITPFPSSLTSAGGTYSFDNITASRSITVTIELDV